MSLYVKLKRRVNMRGEYGVRRVPIDAAVTRNAPTTVVTNQLQCVSMAKEYTCILRGTCLSTHSSVLLLHRSTLRAAWTKKAQKCVRLSAAAGGRLTCGAGSDQADILGTDNTVL